MENGQVYVVLEDAAITDTQDARVDILHQCLLVLQDSDLNKSNLLRVYVRTIEKELIEISPSLHVPKSLDQFELILRDLKINRKVRSQNSSTVLLKFIKNEMENVLPPGSRNIGLSNTGTCVKLRDYLTKFKNVALPLVFHVGAISTSQAHGTINNVEEIISISPHGLTAAHCCAKICNELVGM